MGRYPPLQVASSSLGRNLVVFLRIMASISPLFVGRVSCKFQAKDAEYRQEESVFASDRVHAVQHASKANNKNAG